ncbi:hypothetical protein [Pseudomonas extremaustralis]|jgi:hypothetical protein|uniref:Uncharacterized protein n=1 Tax=Pseudomonas extremaustralis TaxID=359110 RepID=A0A5C5PZA9_9PSED|nr:hypothetical protein [Pseudomonas extremaustralis]EZI23137.1 hypothetical protein PE143B_0130790 [Pseudomonas extremaustralis 14-3 substr. 14-3b]TWR96436.1 hypothetical protein FIV36_30865 [Pseudomonas extremaustralis]SDE64084.1 hypothetical protein SAMN05216591_0471 [Pseudomonas extremaustralis]
MTGTLENLTSGLIGGALGVLATLAVAYFQLKQIAKHHREAMDNNKIALEHQNTLLNDSHNNQIALLKETYKNQLSLISAEQRINSEVLAIKEIQLLLNGDVKSVHQLGRDVYHDHRTMLLAGHVQEFNGRLVDFRDKLTAAVGQINVVIDDNRQHWRSLSHIEATIKMIHPLWGATQELINKISGLSLILTEETLPIITSELRAFESMLNVYSDWNSKCKDACAQRLTTIMSEAG